jgi:hypothetical protein
MPNIFIEQLGFSVAAATALSGVVDVFRVAAFAVLTRWSAWHDRIWPLLLIILATPIGFFMVLFGPQLGGWLGEVQSVGLAVVLAGEILFGLTMGLSYYAALYYALVLENAAVNAGGAHEGLIGLGFATGPACGLGAQALAPAVGSKVGGLLVGLGPMFLLCGAAALRALIRMPREPDGGPPPASPG